MASEAQAGAGSTKWEEERMQFEVLRAIHGLAGSDFRVVVTGSELSALLPLPCENLYRAITCLSEQGYLEYLGAGPRVSITPSGVAFLEEGGRRRSVRG